MTAWNSNLAEAPVDTYILVRFEDWDGSIQVMYRSADSDTFHYVEDLIDSADPDGININNRSGLSWCEIPK